MVDEYRAAVRYDLIRHGFRLEDVGTERLWWPDAIAILQQQTPANSALFRELFPDKYNRDLLIDRLETLAVLIVRGQHLLGKQSDVDDSLLPNTWDDLWNKKKPDVPLMTFSEIDERMGWESLYQETAPPEMLTTEEIDKRMGWG